MSHLLAPAVTLLTVYRPDSEHVTVKFFEEFATVLEGLITRNSQLIIVGDFNIHVEDHMDSHSIQFSALLKQFGLHQHVREPTFVRGGTLDLVITSDISTESPHTSAGNISPLTCGVYSSSPSRSAIRVVKGWNSLDYQAFSEQIRSLALGSDPRVLDAMSVIELFDLYSNTMSDLLDKLLPPRKIKTRVRPLAVWFGGECRQLRRRTRALERRYRSIREPADRLTWISQLRALHRLYRRKEAEHWENLVTRDEKNPKRLWSTILGLLGHASRTQTSPNFTVDDFQKTTTDKIENLRAATASAQSPEFSTTECKFDGFHPILDDDLRRIISSNQKSCELDPLPPFIIINILDDIIEFLVYMFNQSLSEGCLPESQKRAIVFPALKKLNLDPNVCLNYRLISNLSYLSKTLERLVSAQLVPYLEQSGLNLVSEVTIPPKLSSFHCSRIYIQLLTDLTCPFLHSSMSPQPLTWLIISSSLNLFICPSALTAHL